MERQQQLRRLPAVSCRHRSLQGSAEVPVPSGAFPSWQHVTFPATPSAASNANVADGAVAAEAATLELREGLKVFGHVSPNAGSARTTILAEIAFRGSTNVENWLANFQFELTECAVGYKYGLVHQGFQRCYLQLQGDILAWLRSSLELYSCSMGPDVEVRVSGHSLGGALATLCAYDLASRGCAVSCITWGSPKVGNDAFRDDYCRLIPQTARFVTKFDPVPRLPPDRADTTGNDSDFIFQILANLIHQQQEAWNASGYVHVCPATQLDDGFASSVAHWANVAVGLATLAGALPQSEASPLVATTPDAIAPQAQGTEAPVSSQVALESLVPHALPRYEKHLEERLSGVDQNLVARQEVQRSGEQLWGAASNVFSAMQRFAATAAAASNGNQVAQRPQ
mmetsp:Transcript_17706/g.41150  ORF Transcript_17706/g.41150 Transcript_17706/m.41150 type:complete len:398 (-) Transcript_17706:207-1400(-)